MDQLDALANRTRECNTDDWRQYWNEEAYGRPESPKIEEHCRDALLSDLRKELPAGVIAEPEVEYANDKRADIGVFYGGFNVPVEIKRDQDPRLWSALRDQLIARCASGSATGEHGVYLVFWFSPNPPKI